MTKGNNVNERRDWECSCGKKLGEFIGENRVKIWGANGQPYEIGFNYIDIACKFCEKEHRIKSPEVERSIPKAVEIDKPIPDTITITVPTGKALPLVPRTLFDLAPHERTKIKGNLDLSEKREAVFDMLSECEEHPSEEELAVMAEKLSMPLKKIKEGIRDIGLAIYANRKRLSDEGKV